MAIRWRRAAAVTLLVVLFAPVSWLLMLVVHETGHTVVAWLLGDTRATFVIYGHTCVGCNLYDSQRLSPWGNVAVSLGGIAGTVVLTVVAIAVLAWRGRPRWLPRWLLAEAGAVCYLLDFVLQFVLAVQQLPVPAREPVGWGVGYTDLDAAVSFGSQATGWGHGVVAAAGLAAAAAYTAALAVAVRWAWRRAGRPGGRTPAAGPALPEADRGPAQA